MYVLFCIPREFGILFERVANMIFTHLHLLQAPGPTFLLPDTEKIRHLEEGGITTVYCIKMYSGFY